MIELKLPDKDWPDDQLTAIYNLIQATPELGFNYRTGIHDHVVANRTRGTIWAAYLNSELAGVAMVGSRRLYPHLLRHGEIAVKPEYRRQRVGTSLYYAQILQAYLEGRREVEDTIIASLSPWMRGPTDCGIGFLPSLGYTHYGTLPRRTSGFRDIELWGRDLTDINTLLKYSSRVPSNLVIELYDTPAMRDTFVKNTDNYAHHDVPARDYMDSIRGQILGEALSITAHVRRFE